MSVESTEASHEITLSWKELLLFWQRLPTSIVSAGLFERHRKQYNELPTHLSGTVLDALSRGKREVLFLYDPDLIEALHHDGTVKAERSAFQANLEALGSLTTKRQHDSEQFGLRQGVMEYLKISQVNENAGIISKIAQKHMAKWQEQLARGESIPLSKANHLLFVEYVEKTMVGRELSEEFKKELMWQFLDGIKTAVLPDALTVLAPRAARLNKQLEKIIKENFERYAKTGEKSGVIDAHLEFFLMQHFGLKDDEAGRAEMEKLRHSWHTTLAGTDKEKKELLKSLHSVFIDEGTRIDYTVNYQDWVLLQLFIYIKYDITDSLDFDEQEKGISRATPYILTESTILLALMKREAS